MNKHLLRIITIYVVSIITYFAKNLLIDNLPDFGVRWVGGVILTVAIIYLIFELKSDYPYFYGASQSAGSNANAAVVAGLGIGILSLKFIEMLIIATGCILMYLLLLLFFSKWIKVNK